MPDTPSNNRFVVIARDGLKLRGGPSIDFGVVRTIPEGRRKCSFPGEHVGACRS